MQVKDLYYKKYLKYKNKYSNLLNQIEGGAKTDWTGKIIRRESVRYDKNLSDMRNYDYSNIKPIKPTISWVRPIYSIDGPQAIIAWKQDIPAEQENPPNLNEFDYQIKSIPEGVKTIMICEDEPYRIIAFVKGLTYDIEYTFFVQAINMSTGLRSAYSVESKKLKIHKNVPNQPIIKSVEIINGEAKITWNFIEKDDGGGLSGITYDIYMNGRKMQIGTVEGTANSAIIREGIIDNQNYTFRLQAVNEKGKSIMSIPSKTMQNVNKKPNNPTDITVTYGPENAFVEWKMTDFGNGRITKYEIIFTPILKQSDNTRTPITKVKTDTEETSYLFEGLTKGVMYYCTIKAYNSGTNVNQYSEKWIFAKGWPMGKPPNKPSSKNTTPRPRQEYEDLDMEEMFL
jgi:hypothetical protein